MKSIDEEVPFEIPKGWEWVRLETILNIGSARRVHAKDWRTVGIPFYRAREIGKLADDGFVDNELYIDLSLYEEFSPSGIPLPKDLMITAVGTLGKVYIVKDKDKFYYKDGSVLCLANKYGLCAEFLKIVLESPSFKMQYKQESQGTTVATLTMVRLQKYFIPLPPLKEQYRIVEKLAELLPQIDKYNKVQNQLDELNTTIKRILKTSILQEAIQGKLVRQIAEEGSAQDLLEQIKEEKKKLVVEGKLKKYALNDSVIFRGDDNKYYEKVGKKCVDITDEIPFDIPENWQWIKLDQGISLLSGRDLEPSQYNDLHHGIPYITGASNFVNSNLIINRWTEAPITISNKGDLLLTCKGTIGSMAFNDIGQIHIARQVMAITSYGIDLKYIKCFLQSNLSILEKNANSMIPGISRSTLLGMLFPLPPFKEQQRIVAQIEKLFEQLR